MTSCYRNPRNSAVERWVKYEYIFWEILVSHLIICKISAPRRWDMRFLSSAPKDFWTWIEIIEMRKLYQIPDILRTAQIPQSPYSRQQGRTMHPDSMNVRRERLDRLKFYRGWKELNWIADFCLVHSQYGDFKSSIRALRRQSWTPRRMLRWVGDVWVAIRDPQTISHL